MSAHRQTRNAPPEIRILICQLSRENPLWGAPHVHGELQMLGIVISQTTVAKSMLRHRKPPSQTWRTFLDNHVTELASIDFFTVPTVSFRILYVFLVLRHKRRELVHFNVTEHPTAQWTAQQMVEAFPWDQPPKYVVRDRDQTYGEIFPPPRQESRYEGRYSSRHAHPGKIPMWSA